MLGLAQAQSYPIQAGSAQFQGGVNSLFDLVCRVLPVQFEHSNEFFHATPFRQAGAQRFQQAVLILWPVFAPAAQWFGMFKGSGALLQQS